MISKLHDKLGTAGLIIAVVALIAALTGTAFAAAGLNSKQKKEVKKIAKSFQGKGPKGDPGPAGPAGPAGANGKDGSNGSNGTNGKDGVSPVGTAFSGTKGACLEGGVEYKGATTNLVCNGEAGQDGMIQPGETLPAGASETGSWGGFVNPANAFFDVSFTVPLASDPEFVFVEEPGVQEVAKCPGFTNGVPQATEGVLCVYRTFGTEGRYALSIDPTTGIVASGETGPTGTVFKIACVDAAEEPVEACAAAGAWAVTAGS